MSAETYKAIDNLYRHVDTVWVRLGNTPTRTELYLACAFVLVAAWLL